MDSLFRSFTLNQTVTIKSLQVGVFYRVCQLLCVVYIAFSLYVNSTWAYSEVPGGTTNSWAEPGNMSATVETVELPYCKGDGSYSFVLSKDFQYTHPVCEMSSPYELSSKGQNLLQVTTSYIEHREVGFPCALGNLSACTGRQLVTLNGQCSCTTSRFVYPMAVEEMNVGFSHSYTTTEAFGWWGSSSASPDTVEAIKTTVIRPIGRTSTDPVTFASDSNGVSFSVAEWLNAANVTLDDYNRQLRNGTTGALPRVRTTGALVTVTVNYDNLGPNRRPGGMPDFWNDRREVRAEVDVSADLANWAGAGPTAHYEVYPTGASGNQTYTKIFRYQQGITFRFRSAGLVYKLDMAYLFRLIIELWVLLKVADQITGIFARNFVFPTRVSRMIVKMANQDFTRKGRDAQIAAMAAVAWSQYKALDLNEDNNKEALTRCFDGIPGLDMDKDKDKLVKDHLVELIFNEINKAPEFDESNDLCVQGRTVHQFLECCLRKFKTKNTTSEKKMEKKTHIDFSDFLRAKVGSSNMISWERYLADIHNNIKKDPTHAKASAASCDSAADN